MCVYECGCVSVRNVCLCTRTAVCAATAPGAVTCSTCDDAYDNTGRCDTRRQTERGADSTTPYVNTWIHIQYVDAYTEPLRMLQRVCSCVGTPGLPQASRVRVCRTRVGAIYSILVLHTRYIGTPGLPQAEARAGSTISLATYALYRDTWPPASQDQGWQHDLAEPFRPPRVQTRRPRQPHSGCPRPRPRRCCGYFRHGCYFRRCRCCC